MKVPLEWSQRGLEPRAAARAEWLVRELVHRLEHHAPDLLSCRVTVERVGGQPRSGSPFRVRVACTLPPGIDLAATREPGQGDDHETADVTIRHAFTAIERQIESARARRRGDIKRHAQGTPTVAR